MRTQSDGWSLDSDRMVLDLYADGRHQYEVDLETCLTSDSILDWICQLAGKSDDFISDERLGEFVRLINEILWPQDSVVRGGCIKRSDIPAKINAYLLQPHD